MKKCIIFGASTTGSVANRLLQDNYMVVGFADNDSMKWGEKFCDMKIFAPQELKAMENIDVIIASVYYVSIYKQLRKLGISNIYIFYYVGIAAENKNDNYRLYQLSNVDLFDNCTFNKNQIEKTEHNFSENYLAEKFEEKNTIKKTKRKKVLFCAYIFPPLGGSGVQRSLKFVKYLREYGYEPIVLTVGANDGKTIEDNTLLREMPEDITIIRVDDDVYLPEFLSQDEQQEIYNLYCGVVKSKQWMDDYMKIIKESDARLIPDNRIMWVNACLKQIESRIDLNEIDVVYTTGNPFSTYLIGYYIKKKYGIKWVQDYRDPWGSNDFYWENYYKEKKNLRVLEQELERNLVKTADKIVVVADALCQEYVEKYNVNPETMIEITNGYDEDDFKDLSRAIMSEKFCICYNGSLYGDRSPVALLESVNELIEQKKIGEQEIEWIFNGNVEKHWKELLDRKDKYNIIKYNGYLSHSASLNIAWNSDLLVIYGLQGEGTKIGYCGKIFEYIRMNVPIISFSKKGGVLDAILEKTGTGLNFDYGDLENAKEYVSSVFLEWKRRQTDDSYTEKKVNMSMEAVKEYDRSVLTRKLARVFDEIVI